MDHKDLIRFVPAGSDNTKEEKQTRGVSNESLTGEEAKAFYEDIVGGVTEPLKRGCLCHENHSTGVVPTRKDTHGNKSKVRKACEEVKCKFPSELVTATTFKSCTTSVNSLEIINIKQEPVESEYILNTDDSVALNKKTEKDQNDEEYHRIHNKLLSFAQNGDLQNLKKLYQCEKEIDINFQDSFGWTALMCAAVSKQFDVIKFLLSKGANKYILNSKGQTVLELCEKVGTIDSKIVINTFNRGLKERIHEKKHQKFVCDVCKREFVECSPEEHKSSTVHLFNLRLKPKSDKYVIPETNRGFQLMKKSGWDGETGLGPSGEGSKYPVKTCLKRDRKCLGSSVDIKAKITHFGPKDVEAVKSFHKQPGRVMSAKTISKRERKKREQRNKQWERNLRTYMNIDL